MASSPALAAALLTTSITNSSRWQEDTEFNAEKENPDFALAKPEL
jgi:hypothetical protein